MDRLLELRIDERADGCRVTCRGELGIRSADRLRVAVRTLFRRGRRLTLDLSQLRLLDDSGVVALQTLHRHTARHGTRLEVHTREGTPAARTVEMLDLAGSEPFARVTPALAAPAQAARSPGPR